MEAIRASSEPLIVPVLTMHVERNKFGDALNSYEKTSVVMDNYFLTPEASRGGKSTQRMGFQEAVNRMIF